MRMVKSGKAAAEGSALGSEMEAAFNAQLNREFYSSYLYLSMSAYFDSENLPGHAHWMRLQADEEYAHAMKFFLLINDRGGRVQLTTIAEPQSGFGSSLEAFSQALEHEREISDHIGRLYEQASSQNDHASVTFLQWFVNEQVEEEKTLDQLVATLGMIGGEKTAMWMFDRELATRTAAPPTA
ncbi:MAG: ferritin [Actinomycetota bacterium]